MPIHQFRTSQAAGAITDNLVSGQNVEFLERPSRVRVWATAEAAQETRLQIMIGGKLVMVEAPISGQARMPIDPDDKVYDDIHMAGERVILRGRNTGAGANVIQGRVAIDPVA